MKGARRQVSPAELQVTDPGIEQPVRFGQAVDGLARVVAVQSRHPFEDPGVGPGLRLGL